MTTENTPGDTEQLADEEEKELLESEDKVEEDAREYDADTEVTFEAGTIPEGQLDATRLYLSEIGFSPLLSAEEEVYYARMAQRGEEAGDRLQQYAGRQRNVIGGN